MRTVCAVKGSGLILLGFCADLVGLGDGDVFGRTQKLIILSGLCLCALGLIIPRSFAPKLLRLFVAAGTTYVALLACDAFTLLLSPRLKNPSIALKGFFEPDEARGYRLAPNWRGTYDDGIVRARYEINALGHRDREPGRHDGVNVLLIGDSFTFGQGLNHFETIDSQLTSMTQPAVDAYNLGVPGYGPPAVFETFRRCDWYEPRHVVYLFCVNDVRDDALLPDHGVKCFDGHLVPKFKHDGSLYTPDEHRQAVRGRLQPVDRGWPKMFGKIMRLSHLRGRFLPRAGNPHHLRWEYSDANVARAATYTSSMASLAAERGATFDAVIIPSRAAARRRRYAEHTMKYVQTVAKAGIGVIEVLDGLSEADYLHEGHLNAKGARLVAERIRDRLGLDR